MIHSTHFAQITTVVNLGSHALLIFLLQIALLLLAALLLGALARRFKLPSVVGELCAGVLLGPSLLGYFAPGFSGWILPQDPAQFHLLDAVGQLGVLLLVGLSGLEINLRLLKRRSSATARISLTGLLVPFAAGIGISYLLPDTFVPEGTNRTIFALFLGVALCVSAIPVMAKTLMDMKLMHRRAGQLALSGGVIDDIFGWIMLSVVAAMVTTGAIQGFQVLRSLGWVIFTLIFAATAGRKLIGFILRIARSSGEDGPTVTAMTALILASAGATHAMGLEAALGAFLCGIVIAADPKFYEIKLPTVLAVLAPIFFATAGLRMDLTALLHPPVLLGGLAVLAVAILGKFIGVYIGARLSKLDRWESLAIGAAMNARGVIEVIIATVGVRLGVLTTEMYTIIVLVAVVTSLMAPPVLRFTMQRVGQRDEDEFITNPAISTTQ